MASGDDRATVYAPRVQMLLQRLAKEGAAADTGPAEEPAPTEAEQPAAPAAAEHTEVATLVEQLVKGEFEDGCQAVVDGLVRFSEAEWLDTATDLTAEDVGLDRDPLELPANAPLLLSACVAGLVAAAGRAVGLRDVTAAAAGRIVVTLGQLPLEQLLPAAALTIRTLESEKVQRQTQQRIEAEQRLQSLQGELLQQSPSSRRRKRREL
jgi:hypothetical protein